MLVSLILTAFVMGLAGGPHCIAMCGAACGAMQTPTRSSTIPIRVIQATPWRFYLGRLMGYALLGALAASSIRGLAWLSSKSGFFQPLWTFSHSLIFAWGVLLLLTGHQPQWAVKRAQQVWLWLKRYTQHAKSGYLVTGLVWAMLPCGLLYSAVMLASLQSHWIQGAMVMAAFALGSACVLIASAQVWQYLPLWISEKSGMRLSGLILIGLSLTALWMDVMHHNKLWCVTF